MELTLQIKDQTKATWLIQLLEELDFVEISNKSAPAKQHHAQEQVIKLDDDVWTYF